MAIADRTAEDAKTVGDLVKASEVQREDIDRAIATIFDGKTALPLANGHALVLLAQPQTAQRREDRCDTGSDS